MDEGETGTCIHRITPFLVWACPPQQNNVCAIYTKISLTLSDSQLNAGVVILATHSEINERVRLDHILLNVILRHIKFMITYKISGSYLKNSLRYCDLKILRLRDFVIPWPTKIAITRLIFGI